MSVMPFGAGPLENTAVVVVYLVSYRQGISESSRALRNHFDDSSEDS